MSEMLVSLHRVFHGIRFKVNKVGTQRSPFFYIRKLTNRTLDDKYLLIRKPFFILQL